MSDHGTPGGRTTDEEPDIEPQRDHPQSPADEPIEISLVPFDVSPSGEGADNDEQPRSPSRGRLIVLGSLVVLGLAGTAVVGTAGYRIASQKDAILSIPEQVGALRRDDSEDARSTAEYLRTALSAEVDLDEAVGAVYTDSGGPDRSVLFFGGTTLVWTPEKDLETAFELMSDDAGAVSGLHDVPPGDLGGTMKCGTTTSPDGDIAVCGWADHGSLALALFPNRPPDEAGTVLATIREAAQKRE